MKYNDTIKQYYHNQEGIGSFDERDSNVGTGIVGAPACGDVMKLQVYIEKNNQQQEYIKDAVIKVFGCGSAKASSTKAIEMLKGKTLDEALSIKDEDIATALGLPKIKLHCSVLAEGAIHKAIENYKEKTISNISTFARSSNEFYVDISPVAEEYISKILIAAEKKLNKKAIGIKIDLQNTKCGLKYVVKYVDESTDVSDDVISDNGKLKVFVPSKIAHIINGTLMDYKESDDQNFKSGIVFKNPNELSKCGCGENFQIEEKVENIEETNNSGCCNN